MDKAKYLKSVFRFLIIITIINISILNASIERGTAISFQKVIKYYPLLPKLTDPFPPKEKTLSLKSSHSLWNGHFLNATKRLRKIKKDDEVGIISGTLVMYHRYERNDLQIPAIMTIDWYKNKAIQ